MFLRRWQGTPLQWQLHILYKSFKFCKLAFLVYSVTPKPLSMNCMLLMPPESSAGSYFALHSGICWQNGNDEKKQCVEYVEFFPEAQVLETCSNETMQSYYTHCMEEKEGLMTHGLFFFYCCASPAHFTNSSHIAFLIDCMA